MNDNAPSQPKRRRGRPVGFDRCQALHQAMQLFWERGYEGTSFDQLIGAMGISPSSFYAAFGSKERLYRETVDAYAAQSATWFVGELAAAKDARTALHNALSMAARKFTQGGGPTGCMISLACITVPPSLAGLRDDMTGQRRNAEAAMAARIRRGVAEGDMPADTDVDALAAFYSTLSRGLAVQARDGMPYDQLQVIVDLGMQAWPAAPPDGQTKRVT